MKSGLIGRKLGHSFSPEIHSYIGEYEYRLYPMEPEQVADFLRDNDLDGFNVTIPYKEVVIPHLAGISDTARAIGAVNTVIRRDGGLYGDNTDYYGFLALLGEDGLALRGGKALVLGSGGASKSAVAVLRDHGFAPVVISRSGEDNYQNLEKHADAKLIVNATPVGMYPENGVSPVDLDLFPGLSLVLDMVYNPLRTRLILDAEARGIPARNGMLMLAAQGVKASELIFGTEHPAALAQEITGKITRRMQNVCLIGMPGVGKTTVGRILAEQTGREFVDTDELIRETAGRSPAEIIRAEGEPAFRAIETAALREATKKTGRVIATGGGIVTVPENRDLLRQNGGIVWLTRDLDLLDTADRPVSQAKGLRQLYAERASLYEAWADVQMENTEPNTAAKKIAEALFQ